MRVSKLGSMVAVLGLAGLVSVACGDDDGSDGGDGPVGGAGGSGGEPVGGGVGGGAAGEAPGGSGGSGGSGGAGASGGGAGGALGGEGGQSGAGGASGGAACQYEDESYEVGQRFVTGGSSPELCTCEASGEVTCLEQYDGCDGLLRDLRDVVDRAKTCDRDGALEQCGVEATVKDFFCGSWRGLFTAEHVGELDAITELGTLSAALGCDASITPCGDGPKPTESFCSAANRCEDRWTGQNQLENGGFELATAGLPEKWSIALADRPAYSLDSSAKSGVAALKLSVGQLGHEYEVSQSPVGGHRFIEAGSRLLVTGHYRIDALGGDVSFAVRMGNAYYPIPAPTEAGVWKEFQITTYATAQYRFNLGLVVQQDAGTLANVWFDDVQVELLP